MDDRQDRGLPPAPEGIDSPPTQIVPHEGDGGGNPATPARGLVWCVIGALVGFIAPPFAAYFAAMGAAIHSAGSPGKTSALAAPAVLCLAGLAFGTAPADVLLGLSAYVAGCLFGIVVACRGTSFTVELLLAICLAAAFIAVDVWRAHELGTTIGAVVAAEMDTVMDLYRQQVGDAAASSLDKASEFALLLWPMSYFAIAAVSAGCAHLGARAGLRRIGRHSPRTPLAFFDTPLWVVGALAAAILMVAAGVLLGEGGKRVLMVGLNVLALARIVLMLDGLGVLAFVFTGMGIGRLGLVLVLAIAVNVELSLPIMSGLGLVDFWANFRRLVRGSVPSDESQG